jgi:hypothetical protein
MFEKFAFTGALVAYRWCNAQVLLFFRLAFKLYRIFFAVTDL